MLPDPFQTTVKIRKSFFSIILGGDRLTLRLHKGIDWFDLSPITQALAKRSDALPVVCDCSAVVIDNTVAVGWLVALHRWCMTSNRGLRIEGLDPAAMARFHAIGLDQLLPVAAA